MKNLFLALTALQVSLFYACSSNETNMLQEKKQISFVIEYEFDISHGENMTRSNQSDIYDQFYNDRIKNGSLVAKKYNLEFVNKETGAMTKIAGNWESDDLITLLEGEYTVTGDSYDDDTNYIQEKASISFSQDIQVTKDTKLITLTARYECFLLFFDNINIKSLVYWCNPPHAKVPINFSYKNYLYTFARKLKETNAYIEGNRNNGSSFSIYTSDVPFELGKYYFFNPISNSFDIPKMDAGN